ncbi:hypothetical protein ABK040_013667 [Willaertia magna]
MSIQYQRFNNNGNGVQLREIIIIVGDKEFRSTVTTLTKNPEYKFNELSQTAIIDNKLFIDRNPITFSLILDHLRGYDVSFGINKMSNEELSYLSSDIIYYKLFDLIKYLPRQCLKYLKKQNINVAQYGAHFTKFDPNYFSANARLLNSGDRVRKYQGGAAWNCGVLGDNGCYNYKIKIINGGANNCLMIGFALKNSFLINGQNYSAHGWYFYYYNGSKYSQLGENNATYGRFTPKNGTVIEATYDPNAGTISFKVDDVDLGIAYNNINAPVDFCPAFDIYEENIEFEFI